MSLFNCRPSKWVWGIVPLALPFLGAWYLNTPQMTGKLSKPVVENIKKSGLEMIRAQMDGRDVVLTGQAESKESVQNLSTTLLGTYGIRRVDASGVKIIKPVVLNKPTVKRSSGNNAQPKISGTWPNKSATTLKVSVGGKSYVLGADSRLSSDKEGNWTLEPENPLGDGVYDVVVAITDGKKAAASDNSKGEVMIDTTPPKAPTITTKLTTKNKSPKVSGTFAATDAATLAVSIEGSTFILGKNKELSADKKGNWSMTPSQGLADGSYDITAKSTDKFGNESKSTAKQAITIDTTPPIAGTVDAVKSKKSKPKVTGKWPSRAGNTLAVVLAGKNYVLGKNKELTSDGAGNWFLSPIDDLKEGQHPLTIITSDALGNKRENTVPNAITIDKTAPKAPAITSTINAKTSPVIAGTWAKAPGNNLRVVVSGKVFVLGRDKQLTSDSKGNWTLSLAQPLGEGKHSILAESSDQLGNIARSHKPVVLVVDTTKPDPASIKPMSSNNGLGEITGTWPQKDGNQLNISVGDQNFELGKDEQLSTDGNGNWALKLTKAIKEGIHKVVATVSDKAGNSSKTESNAGFEVDLTPPPSPTVTTVLSRQRTPLITGTWSNEQSQSLVVKFANQTYSSQKKGEISINGDHWSVQPTKQLRDGTYNIEVTATDKVGNVSKDVGKDELIIDGTSPAVPTVRPIFGTNQKPTITGTWQQDGENTLSVVLDAKPYSIGSNDELKSDGKGNWSLTPSNNLEVGSYDVVVTVADRMGNISTDISKGEVWVKAQKKTEPVTEPIVVEPKKTETLRVESPNIEQATMTPIRCQKEFLDILADQKILFDTNKTSISPQSQPIIVKLSKAAKACPAAKVEISGHTDSRGSTVYNQSLSEGRASAVLDALVRQGVIRNRLKAVGYGETKPIAGNNTAQDQAKNRRIEFNVNR